MSVPVVAGAQIRCTLAVPPGTGVLAVSSQTSVLMGGKPRATIQDVAPVINIGSCGMCNTQSNPAVAAATAAALGTPTPAPCVPSPVGTWQCSPAPTIVSAPGLLNDGMLMCAYGGSITVQDPGQTAVVK